MKQSTLANQVKSLRARKGYSQELLSEQSGLSLRTIQRIENGETEPRGDTLKRLAAVFEVTPDELVDWTVQQDTGFLMSLNLSALSFLVFPLLGVIIPLISWVSKKGKITGVDYTAKELLNFQLTLNVLLLVGIVVIPILYVELGNPDSNGVPFDSVKMIESSLLWCLFIGFYNLVMILLNTYRIYKGRPVLYTPKFRFIKR